MIRKALHNTSRPADRGRRTPAEAMDAIEGANLRSVTWVIAGGVRSGDWRHQ
jgi:hypothetical protein